MIADNNNNNDNNGDIIEFEMINCELSDNLKSYIETMDYIHKHLLDSGVLPTLMVPADKLF